MFKVDLYKPAVRIAGMDDFLDELDAVRREVANRDDARVVVLRREYAAAIDDVWDAVTNPERIPRWFLPVSGDFRLGGRYQIEGNAGGEILQCEPPSLLRISWIFGEPVEDAFSEVAVRLAPAGDTRTTLELEHVATVPPEQWTKYGPGAVGVGWDLTLLGLAVHLRGGSMDDVGGAEAWSMSPDGQRCITISSEAWGEASVANGAKPDGAAVAVRNTTAFYTGTDHT
jgi:uncharacterized protein YndB with AHSA1/START domain